MPVPQIIETKDHPAVACLQRALVQVDDEMKSAEQALARSRAAETSAETTIMKLTKDKIALIDALAMVRKRVEP